MAKTICDNCIHDGVCGLEGHLDEALTFCANKSTGVLVKRGKWIDDDTQPKIIGINATQICSVCRHEAFWDTDYGQEVTLFDYCPYCGADLRDEESNKEVT